MRVVLVLLVVALGLCGSAIAADQCVKDCKSLHGTNSTSCSADANCVWSVLQKSCFTSCSLFNRAELCSPIISVAGASNFSYTPQTLVSTGYNPVCYWDAPNGACRTRCQNYLSSQCPNNTYCAVVNNVCVHTCSDVNSISSFFDVPPAVASLWKFDVLTSDVRAFYCNAMYQGQCTANPSDGRCTTSCSAKYGSNMVACAADAACTSIDRTQTCAASCRLFLTAASCGSNASSHCVWQSNTSTCETNCALQRVDSNCTALPSTTTQRCAVYANLSNTCRQSCSAFNGNSGNCLGYLGGNVCDYLPKSAACVLSCNFITDIGLCGADANCRWSARLDACVRLCSTFDNTSCVSASASPITCRLYADGTCNEDCDEQYLAARSNAALSSTSTCPSSCTFTGAGACIDVCSKLAAISCVKDPNCRLSATGSCVAICAGTAESACTTPNCEWSSIYGCYDSCSGLSSSVCGTSFNSPCVWSVGRQQCMQQCQRRTTAACTTLGTDCDVTRNGVCHRNCTGLLYSECNTEYGCAWWGNASFGTCNQSCATKYGNDATNCALSSTCEFVGAVGCLSSCSLFNAIVCGLVGHCELRGGVCVARCDVKHTSQSACTSGGCEWLGNQCAFPCSDSTLTASRATCEVKAHCGWWPINATASKCRKTCLGYGDSTACNADTACTWGARGCTSLCGASLQDAANFTATPCNETRFGAGCVATSPASCTAACESNTQSNCESSGSCVWYERESTCRAVCSAVGEDSCRLLGPRCQWLARSNRCAPSCFDRYATAASCSTGVTAGLCYWSTSNKGECRSTCDQLSAEYCGRGVNTHCVYDSVISRCRALSCTDRATSANCTADAYCAWSAISSTCAVNCDIVANSGCGTTSGDDCHLNAYTKTCQVRCSLLYTNYSSCYGSDRCDWSNSAGCFDSHVSLSFSECFTVSGYTFNSLRGICVPSTSCAFRSVSTCNTTGFCALDKLTNCRDRCEIIGNGQPTVTLLNSACQGDTNSNCRAASNMVGGSDCVVSCTTFFTLSRCQANSGCQWTGSSCQVNCSTVLSAAVCGNSTYHSDQSACFWNATSGLCQLSCANSFITLAACNASPDCEWSDSFACKRRCGTAQSESDCNGRFSGSDRCIWNTMNKTCVASCASTYGTQTRCQNFGHCIWKSYASVCSTRCDALRTDQCTSESCVVSADVNGNTGCADQCAGSGSAFITYDRQQRACADVSYMCDFVAPSTSIAGGCIPACRRFNSTRCTSATSGCQWNIVAQVCEPACSVRYNSTNVASFCAADSQCKYVNFACQQACPNRVAGQCFSFGACEVIGVSTCIDRCSSFSSSTTCTGKCTWDSNTKNCHSCAARTNSSADCLANSVCEYYGPWRSTCVLSNDITSGSTCPDTCLSSPVACGVYTQTTCVRNGRCRWDARTTRCVTRCGSLTTCSAEASCATYPLSAAAFLTTCSETCGLLAKTDCLGSAYCVWADTLNTCEPGCSIHYNSNQSYQDAGCAGTVGCQLVYPSATTTTCAQRCDRFNSATCGLTSSSSRCRFATAANQCRTSCRFRRQYVNYYNVTLGATLSQLQADAATKTYATQCTADTDCTLDFNANGSYPVCNDVCSSMNTQTSCNGASHCLWAGTRCVQQCSSKYGVQQGLCTADPLCFWDTNTTTCKDSCGVALDANSCNTALSTNCIWKAGACRLACARYLFDVTGHNCAVADDTCAPRYLGGCTEQCGALTDAVACGLRVSDRCYWNATMGACLRNCASFTSAAMCSADPACDWDVLASGSSFCRPRCALFTAAGQATCETSAWGLGAAQVCQWLPNQKICAARCSIHYSTGDFACTKHPQCVIYNGTGVNQLVQSCDVVCSERTSTTTCVGRGCSWNFVTSTCFASCAGKYGTSKPDCLADSNCAWLATSGMCADACSTYGTEQQCDPQFGLGAVGPACNWNGAKCVPLCEDAYTTQSACSADPLCAWMDRNNTCTRACGSRVAFRGCINPSWQSCSWVTPDTTATFWVRSQDPQSTNVTIYNFWRPYLAQFAQSSGTAPFNLTVTAAGNSSGCGQYNYWTLLVWGTDYDTLAHMKDIMRILNGNTTLIGSQIYTAVGIGAPVIDTRSNAAAVFPVAALLAAVASIVFMA